MKFMEHYQKIRYTQNASPKRKREGEEGRRLFKVIIAKNYPSHPDSWSPKVSK